MSPHKTILIVLPIFNEETTLEDTVKKTVTFMNNTNYNYTLLISDNNSTDTSPDIAQRLSADYKEVSYLHIPRKGRGLALRTAWLQAEADVLVYMDVDLSSPLAALPYLLDPILNDEVDMTFGSRLKKPHGKAVDRRLTREVTSQGYNLLLQFFMGAEFKDAQCGFKAISKEAFVALEPEIKNNNWFFDSEMLLLGQYKKFRLKEIGIRWVDDPQSSVKIVNTAVENLKEMVRMFKTYHPQSLFRKLFSFGIIGLLSTLGQAVLFLLLRTVFSTQIANFISLVILTILNTLANKRISFRNTSKEKFHHVVVTSILSFLVYWIPTSGALFVAHTVFGVTDNPVIETMVILGSSIVGTILKYLVLSFVYTPTKKLKR